MLGSLQDAEEIAQESLTKAWQRLDQLRTSEAARAWLYKIATNACLDLLKARKRRTLPFMVAPAADPGQPFGPPSDENVWIEPAPDALLELSDDESRRLPDARVSMRESVGLAFIIALQLLPPKQRAVLLLIDVLGWKPQEVSSLLKTTVVSVNSLLQRARRAVETKTSDDALATAMDDEELLRRYITTWQSGDISAFATLLAEDAVLSMPPHPEWYAGRDAIKAFFARLLAAAPRRYRMLPIRANGSPATAFYMSTAGGPFEAAAIGVVSFRDGYVARITRFDSPRLFRLFGLPERLPDQSS
jgi:RNA polymerase sigma-70 factor (ECF subfamily)